VGKNRIHAYSQASKFRGLPPDWSLSGPYGDVLNAVAASERHTTDVVSAVNFDYRGFDTLGEESILFAFVVGATLLLRRRMIVGVVVLGAVFMKIL